MTQKTVFISYSHKDEREKTKLLRHLRGMLSLDEIEAWHDEPVREHADWEQGIRQAINKATVAVMILTPSYLQSHFVKHNEVFRLLERQESDGLSVIPIVAKPCNWRSVPWLEKMNVLPWMEGPGSGHHSDERYLLVIEEIGNVLGREPGIDEKASEVCVRD